MKYITGLFILISFNSFAIDIDPGTGSVSVPDSDSKTKTNSISKFGSVNDSSITDLVIPLYASIQIADYSKLNCELIGTTKKCKPIISKLEKGSKIRILARDSKGNYKIEVFSDEGESQGLFHTSTKFADMALNWNAVSHTLNMLNATNSTGSIEDANCKYGIHLVNQMKPIQVLEEKPLKKIYTKKQLKKLVLRHSLNADGVSSERPLVRPVARPVARPNNNPSNGGSPQTTARPEEDLPPYNGEYLPGCEALKEEQVKEENRDDLKKCIQSMRLTIAVGARNDDGSLDRDRLYDNMFKKLNPKEQAFAAKVFTSIGEVEVLDNKGDYLSVLKVLSNRARFGRQRANDNRYNELDASLALWQFSMYNPDEPGWREVLDPGKAINSRTLDNVIDALVTIDITDTSKYDNVYMYHANYVVPSDWNMDLLSSSFSMDFGDGNITKSSGREYHKFYTPSNGLEGVYIGDYKKRRRNAN